MEHSATKNERATADVMCIGERTVHVRPEDRLTEAIRETRGSLGYRRPHVRAALDLATLLTADPHLNRDPASAYTAFVLAAKALSGARNRLSRSIYEHVDCWAAREMLAYAAKETV